MENKKEYCTVSIDKETKEAIKNLASFTKTPISSVVKDLLIKQGLLEANGSYNTFANWNEETIIRFRRFLELRNNN
jgi:hypothetical protein